MIDQADCCGSGNTEAKWRIENIPLFLDGQPFYLGEILLCNHHYMDNQTHIRNKGYITVPLDPDLESWI